MKILIRTRRVRAGARIREAVAHRLQSALDRFLPSVDRATVQLADVNGPRGGEDKVCRIDVRLRPGGSVFVEESASALGVAVAGAIDRVARAVARTLDRRKDFRRGTV